MTPSASKADPSHEAEAEEGAEAVEGETLEASAEDATVEAEA